MIAKVTDLGNRGFFIVCDDSNRCSVFSSLEDIGLKIGDTVDAELDKVGCMVMRHLERNEGFEVFAHTGQTYLSDCLPLMEELGARPDTERVMQKSYRPVFSMP
jgi:hypothetical protein